MSNAKKKDKIKILVVTGLIVFTMVLRLPWIGQKPIFAYISHGTLYALIYFVLFLSWGISLQRRIIQKQTLRFLLLITGLMIFWFLARTSKYIYVPSDTKIERWLWYAYYIPMLLIPLMGVFVSLSLGKQEDYKLPPWTKLVYIPTVFLIALVLTNDLHQLVFRFPEEGLWTSRDYQYGPLYWLVWLWMVVSLLASPVIAIVKGRASSSKKILYLPLLPYLGGLIYGIIYIMGLPFLRVVAGDMTAIFCLFTMGIFESLIQSGLIRSNIHYEELFYGSDLQAQIQDSKGQTVYQTRVFPLENGENVRRSSNPILGGRILWLEDVSEARRIIRDLEEVNRRLSEENNLLQAELELKERRIKIEEKNRLYDKITEKIKPQLQALDCILSDKQERPQALEKKFLQICLLGTFIKRRSNLFILAEDNRIFPAKELEYCLRESMEAIALGGVDTSLKADCRGKVKGRHAILAYDIFEEIMEEILLHLEALFINLQISKNKIKIKFQINLKEENQADRPLELAQLSTWENLLANGGHIHLEEDVQSMAILLELPKGGGEK